MFPTLSQSIGPDPPTRMPDVNECEEDGACDEGYRCVNIEGSYECIAVVKNYPTYVPLLVRKLVAKSFTLKLFGEGKCTNVYCSGFFPYTLRIGTIRPQQTNPTARQERRLKRVRPVSGVIMISAWVSLLYDMNCLLYIRALGYFAVGEIPSYVHIPVSGVYST